MRNFKNVFLFIYLFILLYLFFYRKKSKNMIKTEIKQIFINNYKIFFQSIAVTNLNLSISLIFVIY